MRSSRNIQTQDSRGDLATQAGGPLFSFAYFLFPLNYNYKLQFIAINRCTGIAKYVLHKLKAVEFLAALAALYLPLVNITLLIFTYNPPHLDCLQNNLRIRLDYITSANIYYF